MSTGSWRGANHFALAPDDWEAAWGFDSYAPTPGPGVVAVTRSNSFNPTSLDSGRGGLPVPEPRQPMDGRGATGPSSLAGIQATQSAGSRFAVPEDANPWTARVAMPEPPSPSPQRFTGQWGMPLQARSEEDSKLTPDEQKAVLKKLKKEIYNPSPKRFSRRVSLYYRDQARKGPSEATRKGYDDDEDAKRCAICLEDFEPREEVRVTPCDHMFHEDCIVPWAKSHGQCPVCRSVFCDRLRQHPSSYGNNTQTFVGNDLLVEEIASMIRLMEEAIRGGRLGR